MITQEQYDELLRQRNALQAELTLCKAELAGQTHIAESLLAESKRVAGERIGDDAYIQDLQTKLAQAEQDGKQKSVWVLSSKTFAMVFDTKESAINYEQQAGMATGSLYIDPVEMPIFSCDAALNVQWREGR